MFRSALAFWISITATGFAGAAEVDASPPDAFTSSAFPEFRWTLECKGLARAGAESVEVHVKPSNGSFGSPVLVGIKEGTILWSRPFPNAELVNTAKLGISCERQLIDLSFQFPAQSDWVNQHYRWDGRRLTHLRKTVSKVR
jgi:hypothetical protein